MILLLLALITWGPGGSYASPDYENMRVEIVDAHPPGHGWIRDRDAALHEWNQCGSVLLVVTDLPKWTPQSITLVRDTRAVINRFDQDGTYGGWTGTYGLAVFQWFDRSTIAHEVGHALGFNHPPNLYDDTTHVMGGGEHVSPTECQALRQYYGRR